MSGAGAHTPNLVRGGPDAIGKTSTDGRSHSQSHLLFLRFVPRTYLSAAHSIVLSRVHAHVPSQCDMRCCQQRTLTLRIPHVVAFLPALWYVCVCSFAAAPDGWMGPSPLDEYSQSPACCVIALFVGVSTAADHVRSKRVPSTVYDVSALLPLVRTLCVPRPGGLWHLPANAGEPGFVTLAPATIPTSPMFSRGEGG